MYKKMKFVFEKVVDGDLTDPKAYKLKYFNLEEHDNLPQIYLNSEKSIYKNSHDGDLQGCAIANSHVLDNYYSKGDILTIQQKEELEKIIIEAGNILTEITKKLNQAKKEWSGTEVLEY